MWKKICSVVGTAVVLFFWFAFVFNAFCQVIEWPFTWENAAVCYGLMIIITVWLIFTIAFGVYIGKCIYADEETEEAGDSKPFVCTFRQPGTDGTIEVEYKSVKKPREEEQEGEKHGS